MKEAKRPNSRRNLDIAIDRLCASTGDEPGRVKRLLATAIVGQMLPDGAAKGGNALKIRFGKDTTRFSRDLDTARASSLDDYIARFQGSPPPRKAFRPRTSCAPSRSRSLTTASRG